MMTTWIVQTNVEPESTTPASIRHACRIEGRPFQEITVDRGGLTLPDLTQFNGPVVFHGRTTLILSAFDDPIWRRGVFFDPERFQHRAYVAAYGDNVLNADARIMSWDELLRVPQERGKHVFLKPNDDLKRFSGTVIALSECRGLYDSLRGTRHLVDPTTEVVVGEPREIDAEWRLFVVDGTVVTGSMYRPSGDPYVPRELMDFAEDAISQWTPASVFVLDVARAEGMWKIIECNCFNGSGFYLADVRSLVRAVSEHQEREQ